MKSSNHKNPFQSDKEYLDSTYLVQKDYFLEHSMSNLIYANKFENLSQGNSYCSFDQQQKQNLKVCTNIVYKIWLLIVA
jgi:hypothetical protein